MHHSSGFAVFEWNEAGKRYDVKYVYSVRKHHTTKDMVTAICSGFSKDCPDGNVKHYIELQFSTINRSASDGSEAGSSDFYFKSEKIKEKGSRITTLKFSFVTNESTGVICFER